MTENGVIELDWSRLGREDRGRLLWTLTRLMMLVEETRRYKLKHIINTGLTVNAGGFTASFGGTITDAPSRPTLLEPVELEHNDEVVRLDCSRLGNANCEELAGTLQLMMLRIDETRRHGFRRDMRLTVHAQAGTIRAELSDKVGSPKIPPTGNLT